MRADPISPRGSRTEGREHRTPDKRRIPPVDRRTRHAAVRLGAAANNPKAIGIIGDLTDHAGTHTFHGRLFIVAQDIELMSKRGGLKPHNIGSSPLSV